MKHTTKRDWAIVKSFKREISLMTRTVRNKAAYSRKVKHPKKMLMNY